MCVCVRTHLFKYSYFSNIGSTLENAKKLLNKYIYMYLQICYYFGDLGY